MLREPFVLRKARNQTVNSIIKSGTFIAQGQIGIGDSKFDPQSLTALLYGPVLAHAYTHVRARLYYPSSYGGIRGYARPYVSQCVADWLVIPQHYIGRKNKKIKKKGVTGPVRLTHTNYHTLSLLMFFNYILEILVTYIPQSLNHVTKTR